MTTAYGEQLPDLSAKEEDHARHAAASQPLPEALLRIPVSVQVVIGTARIPLSEVAKLGPGSTLTLQEKIGSPARMLVNGREVARGELFVLDETDGGLGFKITDVSGVSAES